jgi:hypothetical protein
MLYVNGTELRALEKFVEENLEFSRIGMSAVSDLYENYCQAVSGHPEAIITRLRFAQALLHVCEEQLRNDKGQITLQRRGRQQITHVILSPNSRFSTLTQQELNNGMLEPLREREFSTPF